MILDNVLSFFIGEVPVDPHSAQLWYAARLIIGILFFDALFDLFRMTKNLIFGK